MTIVFYLVLAVTGNKGFMFLDRYRTAELLNYEALLI